MRTKKLQSGKIIERAKAQGLAPAGTAALKPDPPECIPRNSPDPRISRLSETLTGWETCAAFAEGVGAYACAWLAAERISRKSKIAKSYEL